MRVDFLVIIITVFLVVNTYHDGKYTNMLKISKKYMQMLLYAFVGLSLYIFIRKNPKGSKGMFAHANNIIKYMPIDKQTSDLISPIFDFTNATGSISNLQYGGGNINETPQMKRMLNSGGTSSKRSVSETKKKYVASQQNWCCGNCKEQLKATFEVDHKIDLQYGGTNHINNLVALCVECHKTKTMQSNL
jgi:hypothetical protein